MKQPSSTPPLPALTGKKDQAIPGALFTEPERIRKRDLLRDVALISLMQLGNTLLTYFSLVFLRSINIEAPGSIFPYLYVAYFVATILSYSGVGRLGQQTIEIRLFRLLYSAIIVELMTIPFAIWSAQFLRAVGFEYNNFTSWMIWLYFSFLSTLCAVGIAWWTATVAQRETSR